ncbi:Txe/YoeB family addiction module toxin [Sphingobacterium hungaricum]
MTTDAIADIERHKLAGDYVTLRKINILFDELRKHPSTGTGTPERLKHYAIPTWSRRINRKHRLIYRIEHNKVIVLVISAHGHYEDK